jgi:hypothetical protein
VNLKHLTFPPFSFAKPWELEKLGIRKTIEFLLDTGASRTTILDNDAIRLGIDYGKLKRFKPGTLGIGGMVETFILPNVKILFRTENGFHEEKLEEVFVLRHKVKEIERIRKLPSLLGRDVINKYVILLERVGEVVLIQMNQLVSVLS